MIRIKIKLPAKTGHGLSDSSVTLSLSPQHAASGHHYAAQLSGEITRVLAPAITSGIYYERFGISRGDDFDSRQWQDLVLGAMVTAHKRRAEALMRDSSRVHPVRTYASQALIEAMDAQGLYPDTAGETIEQYRGADYADRIVRRIRRALDEAGLDGWAILADLPQEPARLIRRCAERTLAEACKLEVLDLLGSTPEITMVYIPRQSYLESLDDAGRRDISAEDRFVGKFKYGQLDERLDAAAKEAFGFALPHNWNGNVQYRENVLVRIDGKSVVEQASLHAVQPEFYSLYAQLHDGTHELLADYDTREEALRVNDALAMAGVRIETDELRRALKLACIHEDSVLRDPQSTDEQLAQAEQRRKAAQRSAELAQAPVAQAQIPNNQKYPVLVSSNTDYGSIVDVIPDAGFREFLRLSGISPRQWVSDVRSSFGHDLTDPEKNMCADQWQALLEGGDKAVGINRFGLRAISFDDACEVFANYAGFGSPALVVRIAPSDMLKMTPGSELIISNGGQIGIHDFVNGTGAMVDMTGTTIVPGDITQWRSANGADRYGRLSFDEVYGMAGSAFNANVTVAGGHLRGPDPDIDSGYGA